ncbi:AraC family transcriptional regulator [Pseudoclavibacter sp. RFBA6]|uniref:AraC family transcriptional regulator n=1 Tax=Pseudoclavibacter sp. RFBA6 TaxID=2080573 RepID=UPI0011B0B9DF|nr:AraC family transcriptional regulator [Pseudoclavibacter sp. RFBA6]
MAQNPDEFNRVDGYRTGLALSGDETMYFMASHGWTIARCEGVPQILSDHTCVDGFLVARIWHTPMRLVAHKRQPFKTPVMASLAILGSHRIETKQGETLLNAGDLIVSRSSDLIALETNEPTARLILGTAENRLSYYGDSESLYGRAMHPPEGVLGVLRAAITASLNAPTDPSSPAYGPWRRGLEHLLAASISATRDVPRGLPQGSHLDPGSLLGRAVRVILDRAHDPDFSAGSLTRVLAVSTSNVHRVFREVGLTPAGYLRGARLSLALMNLNGYGGRKVDFAQVAGVSGYRNVRTLLRALSGSEEGRSYLTDQDSRLQMESRIQGTGEAERLAEAQ